MAVNSVRRLRVDLGDSIIDDGLRVTFDRHGGSYESYPLNPSNTNRLKRAMGKLTPREIVPLFGWTRKGKDSYLEVLYVF